MKTAALIGISNYARNHLLMVGEQALAGRLRLAACVVANPEEERFLCDRLRRAGCEIFADTASMWRKWSGKIDLCCIPTGLPWHAFMTLEALAAGANVLVEKPLAVTLADAQRIRAAEVRAKRFVAVGFQDLYTDSTWDVKRRILDGEIGPLKSISFVGLWPRSSTYYSRNDWSGRLRAGRLPVRDSPLSNAFAHFANLALFWAGPKLSQSARVRRLDAELYRCHPIESFDTACVRAELDGGVEFCCHVSHSCREDRNPRILMEGARGTITWERERHYLVKRQRRAAVTHPVPAKLETMLMMADAVTDRLDNPAARICDTAIALEHVRWLEELHAAAPIRTLPDNVVRTRTDEAGDWKEISGVEYASDRASQAGRLWSELDIPWAVRSKSHRAD